MSLKLRREERTRAEVKAFSCFVEMGLSTPHLENKICHSFKNRDYVNGITQDGSENSEMVFYPRNICSEHVRSKVCRYPKAAPCDLKPTQRHQNSETEEWRQHR